MPMRDTIDKIVSSYFAAITKVPFTYKRKEYLPQRLVVSPLIFRGIDCPPQCGGCCQRFSLDYLPSEPHPKEATERFVTFDGRQVRLKTIPQAGDERFCGKLDQSNGRCTIHGYHPFSCDFELIRSLISGSDARATFLTTKLYGRGWAMMRIDGERGARCSVTPPTSDTTADVVRKLNRLYQWASAFGFAPEDTHLPEIIAWASTGPHAKPLVLPCMLQPSDTAMKSDSPAASGSGEPPTPTAASSTDTPLPSHWSLPHPN